MRISIPSIPGSLTPFVGEDRPFSIPLGGTLSGSFLTLIEGPSGGTAVFEIRTAPAGGGDAATLTFADGDLAASWTGPAIDVAALDTLYLRPISVSGTPQSLSGSVDLGEGSWLTTLEEVKESYGKGLADTKLSASELDALLASKIAAVSERIRAYTRRNLTQRAITGERYGHSGRDDLLQLREYPIVSVEEVRIDGSAIAASSYDFDANEARCGHLIETSGAWPEGRRHIEVDYTAGYPVVPRDLAEAATIQTIWDLKRTPAAGGRIGIRQSVLDDGNEVFMVDSWAPDALSRLETYRSHA